MPDKSTSFLHLETQAHGGAFGHNRIPTPTDAQCKAGNYKLGRVTLYGLNIAIEQPRGTYRTGMDASGKRWTSRMAAHYGYFERTRGNDGDGVDCFVGFYPQSERVYIINQNVDGRFDEHKVMLCFPDEETARRAYTDSYARGWPGLASTVPTSISQLKWWLKNGNMTRPLQSQHLPHEGLDTMTRIQWKADATPYDQTLDQVLYGIRRTDAGENLMLDSVTVDDILADSDGVLAFDAMVVPFAGLERRMGVMQRVMERASLTVKPLALQVTEPFTQRGVANVAAIFELSDGQTVSIYFHNPDVTPKKMAATDELISWKWLLNKKDLTIVVAPERGVDLNINEVAKRIMKLAEKNSPAFQRANGKRAETMQRLAGLNDEIAVLETELKTAQHDLEAAKIEAEDRAAKAGTAENAMPDGKRYEWLRGQLDESDRLMAKASSLGIEFKTPQEYMASVNMGETKMADSVQVQEQRLKETISQISDVKAGKIPPAKIVGTGGTNKLGRAISFLEGHVLDLELSLKHGGFWNGTNVSNYNYALKGLISGGSPEIAIPVAKSPAAPALDPATPGDNYVWVEKDIGYAPNRPKDKPYKLVSKAEIYGIATAFGAMPKHSDMVQYFATPDDAAAWAGVNGYTFGENPNAKPTPEPDPEAELRALWTQQGVPQARQDELIGQIGAKAQPGAKVGPFTIPGASAPPDAILHAFPGKDNTQAEVRSRTDGKFSVLLRDMRNGNALTVTAVMADINMAIAQAKAFAETDDDFTPEGRESKVKTAKGTEVVTGFAVVEADRLITSHDPATGDVNPEFPQELQPRDRGRETSRAWVLKTAANLDPEQLGKTRRADTGAPIVGKDRVVESGNGRTMAIIEAYRIGKADEYRAWLESEADYFGLSVAKIKGMKRPVLVRVRTSNVNRAEFAVEANQDDKLAMTATEKARADANRLTDDMIGLMTDNGDLNAAANTRFLSAFLRSLGDAEAAQYSTREGKPTSSLIARVQAAIFAKAYNDDRLLELTADSAKPEIANIISALNFAAPEFIQSAALDPLAAGDATKKLTDSIEASLNTQAVSAIIGATNVIKQAKESGMQVDEFIKQQGLFGDLDPSVAAMAVFIAKNNRSAKRMGAAFKAMATFVKGEIERRQTSDMFGEPVPIGFPEIIAAANRELDRMFGEGAFAIETVDLFARPAEPAPVVTPDPAETPAPTPTEDLQIKSIQKVAGTNRRSYTSAFGGPGDVVDYLVEFNDGRYPVTVTAREGNKLLVAEFAQKERARLAAQRARLLQENQQKEESQPAPATPTEDPKMTADRTLFQSVIDGTVTTPDGEGMLSAALADTLEAAYMRHAGNPEMDDLFEKAINAYTEAELIASANL